MGKKDAGVKIHVLDKDNYFHWKVRMQLHLIHLLHLKGYGVDLCNTISDQTREELRREHEAAENRKSKQALEATRKQDYMSLPSGSDLKQLKRNKGTLESCFKMAHMIYASTLVADYVPPTYNRMRTTLLENEKSHVNFLLQSFRDSWKKKVSRCALMDGVISRNDLLSMLWLLREGFLCL
ncbi:hypothetical protein DCAR_0727222 [Daucus carota subsp. sativus]|uniref:Uncharacterized protein n=1 Tax=Daucus carota subsp. sativus TaxID=79200 RepID=A0AAF0XGT3_DAUCS|nr:hypothetical protein DCAR_0727222 [Daucus carota subsp. sativus]